MGVLGGLPAVLGLHVLILLLVVIILVPGVVKGLLGVVQGILGVVQGPALLLGGGHVLFQIHGAHLIGGDGGQAAQLQGAGEIPSGHELQSHQAGAGLAGIGLPLAGQGGAAGLHLLQRQGGDLPQLVAQLQLLHLSVQGGQGAVHGVQGGVQLHQLGVGGLGQPHLAVGHIFQHPHVVVHGFLCLAVLQGIILLPHRVVGALQRLAGGGGHHTAHGAHARLKGVHHPVQVLVLLRGRCEIKLRPLSAAAAAAPPAQQLPLLVGDGVQLIPQILPDLVKVGGLSRGDVLLQDQDLQIPGPHLLLQLVIGQRARRGGGGGRLLSGGAVLLPGDVLTGGAVLPHVQRLLTLCGPGGVLLLRLVGQSSRRQRQGKGRRQRGGYVPFLHS